MQTFKVKLKTRTIEVTLNDRLELEGNEKLIEYLKVEAKRNEGLRLSKFIGVSINHLKDEESIYAMLIALFGESKVETSKPVVFKRDEVL